MITPVPRWTRAGEGDPPSAWTRARFRERRIPPARRQPRSQVPRPGLSPIEQKFWDAHLRLALPVLSGLVAQHPAGRYRLDFALPAHRIGIELDGHATHSSTAAIARDRQRQRALEARGWHVIRFGGAEVHRDADGCVRQAAALIQRRITRH